MLTKTAVTDEQVVALLAPLGDVRRVSPLSGGLFASVLRADLADGPTVVVKVTETLATDGAVGLGLIRFLGQLFDTLLPALEFFNMGPAIIRETPLDLWAFAWYVVTVFGYSLIYTLIALIVGLILFEERDLA